MIEVDAAVAAGQFESALDGISESRIRRADGDACGRSQPIALLEGSEMTIRLVSGDAEWPGSDVAMPPLAPAFELSRLADTGWGVGRAGMLYRDLLPSRQGGRFIASHIRIPDAGPVPDEVHFHNIRFQLIFCVAGWVRLVYEVQGDDFVLNTGDCVLQPPTIRHRVLESSGGLEVVELTCPALHETWFDPEMSLPTPRQDRLFDGQRFVLHRAAEATWTPWHDGGFEYRDTGIGAAIGRPRRSQGGACRRRRPSRRFAEHDGELQFWFVLSGEVGLLRPDQPAERLGPGDSVAVPAGMAHRLTVDEAGCEFLEVTVPAR